MLEPLEWEPETPEEGARLFLDAGFRFAALAGRSFIRSNLFGTRKVCLKPGVAYAITPARSQGRPSRADQLERLGFRQAALPLRKTIPTVQ